MKKQLTCALSVVVMTCAASHAATFSLEASDNATVRPDGPRSGGSGKAFFNVEGDDNGAFASYGVADFDFSVLGPQASATAISSVTLQLTQDNAGFSLTGPISIYSTTNTDPNIIQPDDANEVVYVSGNNGAASVDADLSPLTLLASSTYTPTATGDVDSIALTFSGPDLAALLSSLTSGSGVLRLVVTPDAADTAATYSGFDNSSREGPTLVIDAVVPEPASVVLAVCGVAVVAGVCRRRRG